MRPPVPRTAAIHDLSGFGRASLTVIIPILSTMGIQVCPLPTAVLSTHTGGFKDYCFVDLSDHMRDTIRHWRDLKLNFDALYSGFLGSSEQIDIVLEFIDIFSREEHSARPRVSQRHRIPRAESPACLYDLRTGEIGSGMYNRL